MIADSFDSRTLANMEVALERACKMLPVGAEQHDYRRYIASKLLNCAEGGDTTLSGLTEAGTLAAGELCARAARAKSSRSRTHKLKSVTSLPRHIG
jgi:hypothetical protein